MPQGRFYTADYLGEMVSANTSWRDRNNPESMTWIEKTIINDEHDGVAHVIGNSKSRRKFDLRTLNGQVGGAKGVRSVGQSYGCNLLYKDFAPTFLIALNKNICAELAASDYTQENIVYSNVKNILANTGSFHLYPNIYTGSAGNLALRLACADGHKQVFMVGMTCYNDPLDNVYIGKHNSYKETNMESANTKFTQENAKTFLTYSDVEFYYVASDIGLMPEAYNWCPNVKEITYLQYYNLAGLGAIAH
jgi:hypothetical protein